MSRITLQQFLEGRNFDNVRARPRSALVGPNANPEIDQETAPRSQPESEPNLGDASETPRTPQVDSSTSDRYICPTVAPLGSIDVGCIREREAVFTANAIPPPGAKDPDACSHVQRKLSVQDLCQHLREDHACVLMSTPRTPPPAEPAVARAPVKKPLKCPHCAVKGECAKSLAQHMANKHPGSVDAQTLASSGLAVCESCGHAGSNEDEIAVHRKKYHNLPVHPQLPAQSANSQRMSSPPSAARSPPPPPAPVWRVSCSTCNKQFPNIHYVKVHYPQTHGRPPHPPTSQQTGRSLAQSPQASQPLGARMTRARTPRKPRNTRRQVGSASSAFPPEFFGLSSDTRVRGNPTTA